MNSMNYDQAVKSLLKAQNQSDIDAVLENADLLDCKTIIRTLLARYNNMTMQGAIELAVEKKNHAHWNTHYECSNCGESVRTLRIECPYCHAMMDEQA